MVAPAKSRWSGAVTGKVASSAAVAEAPCAGHHCKYSQATCQPEATGMRVAA